MCGIAGVLSTLPGKHDYLSRDVKGMIDILMHRGPDDNGIWSSSDKSVVLGHCRLSIVDLTFQGHQPMISSCGRYAISLNGEIYNFTELMSELVSAGIKLRGRSDAEVFLEAISLWGLRAALDKAIGMFAFALWDDKDKILILARDRVGKKPLYYSKGGGAFYFASEIKALNNLKRADNSLDHESIHQYLTFGYIPAPATIYKNIREVPSGSYIAIDKRSNQESVSYWKVDWARKSGMVFDDAVEEADHLLHGSVKMRMRGDVPVGCFLSGGIDSGLLVAMASRYSSKPLKTFTVSFSDRTFDESSMSDMVARRYGTDHQVISLSPDIRNILPKVVEAYDEPFADASAVPSYCVSMEARKYLKVVLNGEGGDELFGGYRRHLAMKLLNKYSYLFNLVPPAFWDLLNRALPQPKAFRSHYAFSHRFLRGLSGDPFRRYIDWCVDGFNESEKTLLYKSGGGGYYSSESYLSSKYGSLAAANAMDHFMAIDFMLNMHDDMLVKMDIATMAHGLEARNPFLDHRIVEWVVTLPPDTRMKGANTKPILRELAKRYLPAQIVNAPKRGFEIPLIKWLQHDLADMVRDICLSPGGIVTDMFNKEHVERLLSGKQGLDPDRWSRRVWILFMLGMWESQNR